MGLSLTACGNKEIPKDLCGTPNSDIPIVEIEKPDTPVEIPSEPEVEPVDGPVDEPSVEEPITPVDISELDFGDGSFNLRLFSTLLTDENIERNLCISPYSLKEALLLVANGAENDSNSYKELLKFMGEDEDLVTVNSKERNNYILLSSSDSATLDVANLVLLDDSLAKSEKIKDNFIKPLEDYYFADVVDKDLQDNAIVGYVNNFTNKATKGTIPEMISEPFSPDAKAVLLNAVYFLGDWRSPFPAENTWDREFYGMDESYLASMMSDEKTVAYKETEDYKSIILPYKSDSNIINSPQFEMVLFIPTDDTKNIFDIFKGLSVEEQDTFFNIDKTDYSEEDTYILLPKFEISNTFGLTDTVKEMGLAYSVSDGNFDFTNIKDYSKDNIGFKIGDIIQKTFIKVDEEGTEASAVTMITMLNDLACLVEEKEPKTFYADKPFMYIIRDNYTNTVLFAGVISNLK